MLRKPIFVVILVFALVTLACRVNFNLPVDRINVGETVTEEIRVESIDGEDEPVRLNIDFGAGVLNLSPGNEDALISGTAVYNVPDFEPEISVDGSEVELSTGVLEIRGIPNFESGRHKNEWDLDISDTPMELVINAGAYQGNFELGGLSLLSLHVRDGASDVDLRLSDPNKVEMEEFEYETGASQVNLHGLANANFERMRFNGGAGDYTLDFSGELLRDAEVRIEAGIGSLTIVIPDGTAARVEVEGSLTNVDTRGDWERSGDEYVLDGSGPVITILISMGAGEVNLETR